MESEGKVLSQAIQRYGVAAQVNMVFEEMSELQKELCKHLRGKDNLPEIAEEIADVEIMLAQMKSITEQAACVWCVLNRVDEGYGSIVETVTAPRQFVGWQKNNPVDETLAALCEDVLSRWYAEKNGEANVGRVLPPDYTFFTGDGQRNHFRNAYIDGDVWDWSLQSPYEN